MVRNDIQAREALAGGEATGPLDNGPVVVDGAEGRDQRVSPPLVDDDLAAGLGEGREIRVGRVVDPCERQELVVTGDRELKSFNSNEEGGLAQ